MQLNLTVNSDYATLPGSDPDLFFWATTSDTHIIDFRAKLDDTTNTHYFFSSGDSSGDVFWISHTAGVGLRFFYRSGAGDTDVQTSHLITDSDWHHYVFIVHNNIMAVYADGVQVGYGTFSVTQTPYNHPLHIGAYSFNGNPTSGFLDGSMDEIRIQNSNELDGQTLAPNGGLTDTYVVPTQAYAVIPPPTGTPPTYGLDGDTKLLLHADSPDNGDKELIDNAGRHVTTLVGTAQLSTTEKKFGSTSLWFDGNSDKTTTPDSADWNFMGGPADQVIECWINSPLNQYGVVFAQAEGPGNEYDLAVFDDGRILAFSRIQNVIRLNAISLRVQYYQILGITLL